MPYIFSIRRCTFLGEIIATINKGDTKYEFEYILGELGLLVVVVDIFETAASD
jgi:hypothetical protein